MTAFPSTPQWMIVVLRGAAVYNLLWAILCVAMPTTLLTAGGLPAPNYPAFIQSLGALVGVFGIGYWMAARDPVAQAELVLLGLLGKLLAPLMILRGILAGELPPALLGAMLINDVLWWFPLAAILWHAACIRGNQAAPAAVGSLAEELQRTRTPSGQSLWDLSFQHPVLIVFVRHLGCTFCREAMADVRRYSQQLLAADVQPVVVHLAKPEDVQPLVRRFGLDNITLVSDPERRLFRAFQLPLGGWWQLFGPRVLWRAVVEGVVFRYGFGKILGDPRQLTGAFLIHRGQVIRGFRAQTSADRTDLAELACSLPNATPSASQ
jgi:peroxiredoxin